MFLFDRSFKLYNFGYYIFGSILLILFSTLGQIPLLAFLPDEIMPGTDPMDLLNAIPSNLRIFLILISFVAVIPGIWLVVTKIHNLPVLSIITSRKKLDFNRVLFSFCSWGSLLTVLIVIEFILYPENYQLNFKFKEFIILSLIAILLVPIQTSVEEIVFRGYLMQGFGNWLNSRLMALILSSCVFGLLHLANPELQSLGYEFIFIYIGVGFVLGIMALMDEGLELSIGFHAANNLIIILLVTADWTVFQTESILINISEPEITTSYLISIIIIYPLLLLFFARKYNWSNWKEKLFSRIRN